MGPYGVQGNSDSIWAFISGDGRYVAFRSEATNLVPDDTNRCTDAFVHDRLTGETTRVSVASDGTQSDAGAAMAGYMVSSISADGRLVVFYSNATNLVPNDTNGVGDTFIRDRLEPLRIATESLPGAVVGQPYQVALQATGGDGFPVWDIVDGELPTGLRLDPDTGVIYGTPEAEGTWELTVGVFEFEDDEEPADWVDFSLTVRAAPQVDVTLVSVVAKDIRFGGNYSITATLRNNGTAPATVGVDGMIYDEGSAPVQLLVPQEVAIGAGASVQVKFSDASDVPRGTYTAAVGIQETGAIEESAPFQVK